MSDVSSDRLRAALIQFVAVLDEGGVVYMLVGALAVAMWGRPRATIDIDFTVRTDRAGLETLVARARPSGFGVDAQWVEWNPLLRETHIRLTRGDVVVDVMRPRDDHDEAALDRRRSVIIDGHTVWLAAPEDLILMKLKAGRPRDFEDAIGILVVQREALDQTHMTRWAERIGIADELAYLLREGGPA